MSVNEPPSREKILSRIMKLLALAEDEGAAENEAKQALAQARRLMLQYGIDEAAVQPLDSAPQMAQENYGRPKKVGREHDWGKNFSRWEKRLASVIGKYFSCQVVFYRKQIIFLGYQADTAAAKYAFDVVLRKMWNLVATRTREHNQAMKEFFLVQDLNEIPRGAWSQPGRISSFLCRRDCRWFPN